MGPQHLWISWGKNLRLKWLLFFTTTAKTCQQIMNYWDQMMVFCCSSLSLTSVTKLQGFPSPKQLNFAQVRWMQGNLFTQQLGNKENKSPAQHSDSFSWKFCIFKDFWVKRDSWHCKTSQTLKAPCGLKNGVIILKLKFDKLCMNTFSFF